MTRGRICGECWQRDGRHKPTCSRHLSNALAALGAAEERQLLTEIADAPEPPADVPQVMACPAPAERSPYHAADAIERLRRVVQGR